MFRWRLLLKTASGLIRGPSPTNADIRSAVNRAYYAALGEAREFATRHGYVVGGRGGAHQRVWHFLRQGQPGLPHWQAAVWKAIGDAGLALMGHRVDADYRAAASPTLIEAQTAIATAAQIVTRVLGLP